MFITTIAPSLRVGLVVAAAAGQASATGTATITNATMLATTNHNVSGVPSGSASDSDGIIPGPFPQALSVATSLNLPVTSGSFMDVSLSGSANIRDDGVDGINFFQMDYFRNGTGNMSASIRTTMIFTVVGSIGYDLTGVFFDTGPGSQLRITDEMSGTQIAGTFLGDPVNDSGILTDGTYRLTAQFNRSSSGSAGFGDSLENIVQYDLTFRQVPAPASALSLAGLLLTRRRR